MFSFMHMCAHLCVIYPHFAHCLEMVYILLWVPIQLYLLPSLCYVSSLPTILVQTYANIYSVYFLLYVIMSPICLVPLMSTTLMFADLIPSYLKNVSHDMVASHVHV